MRKPKYKKFKLKDIMKQMPEEALDQKPSEFSSIEIPDNSELMKKLEKKFPYIMKFERKYQDIDWRGRLYK